MTFGSPPKIVCHKCQKLVDWTDFRWDTDKRAYRLRVYCHGARDEMLLTSHVVVNEPKFINDLMYGRITGTAFKGGEIATQLKIP